MPPAPIKLSIVIPAYNERDRLPPTLQTLQAFAQAQPFLVEILIADDGSTDGSIDVIEAEYSDISILRASQNAGKGAAVRRGLLAAQGEYVLFSDADLSTPIEEVTAMLGFLEEGFDIVIGSRGLASSQLEIRQPWWRELSGRTFNCLVRALSGLPYRDTQCGFKLFRRQAARLICERMTNDGWAFDVEMLMIASEHGMKVKEQPVHWFNREGSKVSLMNDAPNMFRDILQFRRLRNAGQYR